MGHANTTARRATTMMKIVRRTTGHFLSGILPFSATSAARLTATAAKASAALRGALFLSALACAMFGAALLSATPARKPTPKPAAAPQQQAAEAAPVTGARIAQAAKAPQD